MEHEPETPGRPEAVPSATKTPARTSRRAATLFVLVFLSCTFGLLLGYRYLSGTEFMDWYLYKIASQTRAVLSLFGESCRVEDPGQYRDRVAEVRKAIGSTAPEPVPLTAWEAWRFRAITSRVAARAAEKNLLDFEAEPWAPPNDAAGVLAYFRERLARVKRALDSQGGTAASLADEQTAESIKKIEPALEESAWANILVRPDGNHQVNLLANALREAEARTANLLEKRAVVLASKAREDGPRITFVVRSGQDEQRDIAFVFRVVADCGAIPSMAIFLSAVLAFPAAWRKRLIGILAGIPLLYVVNIIRLACLAAVGAFAGQGPLFDFVHHYVWQGIYIVFVVAVWLIWVEYATREKRACPNASQ